MPHGTFLIEWRQEDPPWVWTTPACDSPYERMWKKEAFALLPAFPHDCWRVYPSHSWAIPLLGLEPTLLGLQFRLCGVSLFFMVYWPLGYEDKGSRRSQQGLSGCESDEKNLWEMASVRQLNFIPGSEGRAAGASPDRCSRYASFKCGSRVPSHSWEHNT